MESTEQEQFRGRGRVFEHRGHWLWRRKDTPNWHIYWCNPGSRRVRRRSTGTGDLEQAKRELIAFVDGRQRPSSTDPGSLNVLGLLVDHVEQVMARSSNEWPAEKTALLHWTEFLEREAITSVSDLTLDVQQRYIGWRRNSVRAKGKRGSNATVHRELSVMKAALRFAWKRGLIPSVPYVRSLPLPPSRDRTLSADECRRLLAACVEPHLYRFIMLALHTLQRPGAILDLRVGQVDLKAGRIDFLPPGRVQTAKRRPVVPITAALRPELEQAMRETNLGYVVEYGGNRLLSIKKTFATTARRAGLPGITPYVLRHTGATLLAASGVPLRQIAGMLGHSEQKTTEVYAKHRPEYLLDAAAALDAMFGAGVKAASESGPKDSLEAKAGLKTRAESDAKSVHVTDADGSTPSWHAAGSVETTGVERGTPFWHAERAPKCAPAIPVETSESQGVGGSARAPVRAIAVYRPSGNGLKAA